jgi:positive regulator of sigma E activity|tara:strand:+ start:349 stop:618 length:270 start_codon:yes stop_codon:yes gene_type:complete
VSAEKEFLTSHIALSLSLRGQCALLFNSLLLPLFGFVLGLVLASHLALSEPVSVLCSFAGLGVGMMSCRRFDEHQLNVSEIPEDEVEDV